MLLLSINKNQLSSMKWFKSCTMLTAITKSINPYNITYKLVIQFIIFSLDVTQELYCLIIIRLFNTHILF